MELELKHVREVLEALYGPLSSEELESMLDADEEWVAYGLDLNPITLGLFAVCPPFALWYAKQYPENRGVVGEILALSKADALSAIREGRWVAPQYRDR